MGKLLKLSLLVFFYQIPAISLAHGEALCTQVFFAPTVPHNAALRPRGLNKLKDPLVPYDEGIDLKTTELIRTPALKALCSTATSDLDPHSSAVTLINSAQSDVMFELNRIFMENRTAHTFWPAISAFAIELRLATLEELARLGSQELWENREQLRHRFQRAIENSFDQQRALARLANEDNLETLLNSRPDWAPSEIEFMQYLLSSNILSGVDGFTLAKEILVKGVSGITLEKWKKNTSYARYSNLKLFHIRHGDQTPPTTILIGDVSHWYSWARWFTRTSLPESNADTLLNTKQDYLILTPELTIKEEMGLPASPIKVTVSSNLQQQIAAAHLSHWGSSQALAHSLVTGMIMVNETAIVPSRGRSEQVRPRRQFQEPLEALYSGP